MAKLVICQPCIYYGVIHFYSPLYNTLHWTCSTLCWGVGDSEELITQFILQLIRSICLLLFFLAKCKNKVINIQFCRWKAMKKSVILYLVFLCGVELWYYIEGMFSDAVSREVPGVKCKRGALMLHVASVDKMNTLFGLEDVGTISLWSFLFVWAHACINVCVCGTGERLRERQRELSSMLRLVAYFHLCVWEFLLWTWDKVSKWIHLSLVVNFKWVATAKKREEWCVILLLIFKKMLLDMSRTWSVLQMNSAGSRHKSNNWK